MHVSMDLLKFLRTGVCCAFWVHKLMVFVKHGGFLDIISSNVLSGPFCLIVSSVTSIFHVLVCLMVFHRFWRLFKNLFFRLDNFYWSIFKFISSSRSPILLTSVVIFFWFCTFHLYFTIGSYNFYFYWHFLFVPL